MSTTLTQKIQANTTKIGMARFVLKSNLAARDVETDPDEALLAMAGKVADIPVATGIQPVFATLDIGGDWNIGRGRYLFAVDTTIRASATVEGDGTLCIDNQTTVEPGAGLAANQVRVF